MNSRYDDRKQPKIVQIGFNKCGTTSLYKFFVRNGIRSIKWDKGRLAERVNARCIRGEEPFSDYPDVTYFGDIECVGLRRNFIVGFRYYEYVFGWHPDAYFILNTRAFPAWIRSRLQHRRGGYKKDVMFHLGVGRENELLEKWRLDWFEHHANVLRFFQENGGNLLFFDIECDGGQELVQFLRPDFELDWSKYAHEHRTRLGTGQRISAYLHSKVSQIISGLGCYGI